MFIAVTQSKWGQIEALFGFGLNQTNNVKPIARQIVPLIQANTQKLIIPNVTFTGNRTIHRKRERQSLDF